MVKIIKINYVESGSGRIIAEGHPSQALNFIYDLASQIMENRNEPWCFMQISFNEFDPGKNDSERICTAFFASKSLLTKHRDNFLYIKTAENTSETRTDPFE